MTLMTISTSELFAPAAGGDTRACSVVVVALLTALLVRREVRRAALGADGGPEIAPLQLAIVPLLAGFVVIVVARLADLL